MKKTIILLFIFGFFSVSFFAQAEIPEFTLLLKLKEEGRQPGDFFPELIPHFEANSQMVRERLKSTSLEQTFEETYDFCKSKFEEDGGLTLYSNAMAHFLYAEILKAHQENEENLDFEYNLIKNCFTKNNFKNKKAKEMEEMTCYINKDKNQFHFN